MRNLIKFSDPDVLMEILDFDAISAQILKNHGNSFKISTKFKPIE